MNKIRSISRELILELEREPTEQEIAEKMNLPIEEIKYLYQNMEDTISLDASLSDEEGDDFSIISFIEDKKITNPETAYFHNDTIKAIENVLSTLSKREADILKKRFGLIDNKIITLEEIGKEYGLTKERIRQIEIKALRKMRNPVRANALREYLAS